MSDAADNRPLNIVILGWGSLLWEEHDEFDKQHDEWQFDGPILSLEFCRVSRSRKDALTLVLDRCNGVSCPVAYSFSKRVSPDEAICDLQCREGTTHENIGFCYADGSRKQSRAEVILESVSNWMAEKQIDVVIWTDLASNFQKKSRSKKPFSIEAAISHIQFLDPEGKYKAAEYVWRAPEFIRTPLREALESLPWFQELKYEYPISVCNVKDRAKLETFRAKRAEWISWLSGDDTHSIWPTINETLWDYILFQTINDLRREASEHPDKDVGFNSGVLRLLDAGFVTTQAAAIRRLTDKPSADPAKGVLSLRRLIKDIAEHRDIITREVYVSYDGLPYDPDIPKLAWIEEKSRKETDSSAFWLPTTGPDAWDTAEVVHSNFDRLSGVEPTARSREDVILPKWFDDLEQRLSICDSVRKFVDKFVAHAADPVSREGLSAEEKGITLGRLQDALKSIYQVATFIYGPLLWEGTYGAVPTPQFDHLENLDLCWVQPNRLEFVHDCWNRHLATVEAWEQESTSPTESENVDSLATEA